jgi:hypothetical protein
MKHYQFLKNLEKIKQQFVFENYQYAEKHQSQPIDTNLKISIELAKGVN